MGLHGFRHHRRGHTPLELMISLTILALVISIVIPSMIYLGRTMKGITVHRRHLSAMNVLLQRLDLELTQTTAVESVTETKVVLNGFRSSYSGGSFARDTIRLELTYVDDDKKNNTIEDNRLVLKKTITGPDGKILEQTEETVLYHLSKVFVDEKGTLVEQPVFVENTSRARPYAEMMLRVGDRTFPTAPEDDRITGPGFQSFVVRYNLIPYNLPSS